MKYMLGGHYKISAYLCFTLILPWVRQLLNKKINCTWFNFTMWLVLTN